MRYYSRSCARSAPGDVLLKRAREVCRMAPVLHYSREGAQSAPGDAPRTEKDINYMLKRQRTKSACDEPCTFLREGMRSMPRVSLHIAQESTRSVQNGAALCAGPSPKKKKSRRKETAERVTVATEETANAETEETIAARADSKKKK